MESFLPPERRMENERWLRQNPWRYVLLAHVLPLLIALTFGGLAAAGSLLGLTEGLPDAGRWLIGLVFLWGCVAAPTSLGYLLERRMAWQVSPAGITVYDNSRQLAFMAWSEVAWVRVFPLGWVFAAPQSKGAFVRSLVGVSRESAEWLRQFAREQRQHHQVELGAAADGGRDPGLS